jgi:hypothetical protein
VSRTFRAVTSNAWHSLYGLFLYCYEYRTCDLFFLQNTYFLKGTTAVPQRLAARDLARPMFNPRQVRGKANRVAAPAATERSSPLCRSQARCPPAEEAPSRRWKSKPTRAPRGRRQERVATFNRFSVSAVALLSLLSAVGPLVLFHPATQAWRPRVLLPQRPPAARAAVDRGSIDRPRKKKKKVPGTVRR